MAGFTMKIEGTNRVQNKLRGLASKLPKVTEDAVYEWSQDTRKRLKATKYPPKRPKQKYVRTGKLGSSWQARRQPRGAQILNSAHYSQWVVGNNRGAMQAWMHKGRWWKARDIIDQDKKRLTQMVSKAIIVAWRSGA